MKTTILTACFLTFLFTFSTQTFAEDFTVNLTADQHDASLADGVCDIDLATEELECTLRAAVEQANTSFINDRILFNLSANSTIALTTTSGGEIIINNPFGALEIIGTGANNLTIDGGRGTNRIFFTNFATVIISGVTLTGGNGTGADSGFFGFGGAISAYGGSLTLDSVHVTGNTAFLGSGGGVFFLYGTHRIINSTFSANTADFSCGGFANSGGTLTVVNSTISGNATTGNGSRGGGFCNGNLLVGKTTLRNVTITNNTASIGGGIFQEANTLNFGNTIVAGNTATSGNGPEIRFADGTITSAAGNLVGDSTGDSTNTGIAIAYQPTDIRDVNPMLGALTIANGGTTPTQALLVGSPVIDKGLNALAVDPFNSIALGFDQRGTGFPRIRDGNGDGTAIVDIGAFEVQLGATAASVSVSGRVMTAKGRGISKVRVTLADSNGIMRTVFSNPFGFYSFTDVPAGETYIFGVFHKRYRFDQSTQVYTVVEQINDMNFVADN